MWILFEAPNENYSSNLDMIIYFGLFGLGVSIKKKKKPLMEKYIHIKIYTILMKHRWYLTEHSGVYSEDATQWR